MTHQFFSFAQLHTILTLPLPNHLRNLGANIISSRISRTHMILSTYIVSLQ
jgi:hypothetical protein